MFLLYVSIFITVAMCPAEVISTDCVDGEMTPTADCKGYYECVYGVQTKMADCTEGLFFSASVQACVPEDSSYNDCQVALSIAEKCQMYGIGVYPHPSQCQAFYNCSVDNSGSYYYSEQYMQECPYPNLFNAEANICDDFENVKCGDRVEYTNACDYARNRCPVAHCIPCDVRFPNCDGKPDGMAPHEAKLWSPYFTICYKQRTMGEETCPPDGNGQTQFFHPSLNLCVSLELIPKSHGGLLSDE